MPRWTLNEMLAYEARQAKPLVKSEGGEAKEGSLHTKIIEHCDSQWPRWKYRHARMDKKTTEETGVEDFTLFLPDNKTLHFECKAKGKKLDKDQIIWKHEMSRLGHIVHVIQSFDEFLSTVKLETTKTEPQEN